MEFYGENDHFLAQKWKKVLEAQDDTMEPVKDKTKQMGIARMLENTRNFLASQKSVFQEAAPTNTAGGVSGYDQVVISLVRRMGPQILGNQLVGTQPLTGPTGLAFAWRPRFNNQSGAEIALNNTQADFTGLDSAGAREAAVVATDRASDPTADAGTGIGSGFTTGGFMSSGEGEDDVTAQVAMTVDSVPVQAKTRALMSNFSMEMIQDLAAQHGVDGKSMFGSMMSEQLTSEINYETLRKLYISAVLGCSDTTTPGVYDLNADTDGQWIGEKGRILAMRILHECSQIMFDTRTGHGNFAVVDTKTYNLLANSGFISELSPANNQFSGASEVITDTTTAVGMLMGKVRIYRDDRAQVSSPNAGFCMVGWKGDAEYAAGAFYCPYVPVWSVETVSPTSGQPVMFFKTRAGFVVNPLADTNGAVVARTNKFYRLFRVTGILF